MSRPSASDPSPLSILVFEDDPAVSLTMSRDLTAAGYRDVTVAGDLPRARHLLETQHFDLALLDIHTDDDERAGFDLANRCDALNVAVIFVSGHDALATEGIGFRPRAVLHKPFNKQSLLSNVRLALDRGESREEESMSPSPRGTRTQDYFYVHDDTRHHRVNYADLLYIQSDNGVCHIITRRAKHTISASLLHIDRHLSGESDFARLDKSHTVNLRAIERFEGPKITFYENDIARDLVLSKAAPARIKKLVRILYSKRR